MTDLERVRELQPNFPTNFEWEALLHEVKDDYNRRVVQALREDRAKLLEWRDAHLKEDAVRDRTAEYNFLEAEKVPKLQAELARLRKKLDWFVRRELQYDALVNELDRLREENEDLKAAVKPTDDAWLEVEDDKPYWPGQEDADLAPPISEIEGEKEHYLGFGTDEEEDWDDPDKETEK